MDWRDAGRDACAPRPALQLPKLGDPRHSHDLQGAQPFPERGVIELWQKWQCRPEHAYVPANAFSGVMRVTLHAG
jgi:hypothetical protein